MVNKTVYFFLIFGLFSIQLVAQKLKSKQSEVSFLSEATIEDIQAENTNLSSIINLQDSSIAIVVKMNKFEFPKKLMQEHYNEDYLETEEYPLSKFQGKLNQSIDLSKDGTFPISATGTFTCHGVSKERTLKGTAKVENGKLIINTTFDVVLEEYNIKIPSLLFKNIAEVIDVKAMMVMVPLT